MTTDGPADQTGEGGSVFDRLHGTPAADPGLGHAPVDSVNTNADIVTASREAAGLPYGTSTGIQPVDDQHVEDRDPKQERAAERLVAFWFTVTVLSVIAFVVVFIYGQPHREYYSPVLGGTMGLALFAVGIGAVLWAKNIMPEEEAVQEREDQFSPALEVLAAADVFRIGVEQSKIADRPLLRRSLLAAFGALGALAVVTLRSLGPLTSNQAAGELAKTSWKKGLRMIDTSTGNFANVNMLGIGGFLTVIPEGTEDDEQAQADSVAMLIRLRPSELHPIASNMGMDHNGYVVYSKLCSHLGCPVSLYEQQTHKLLCPCHQSQFLATESARPVFGPASRRLPQLAIDVDADGNFIARDGDFPEPVGPGYWERT